MDDTEIGSEISEDGRVHIGVRVKATAVSFVADVAKSDFDGNFSEAIRTLLSMGCQAWQLGVRDVKDVGKRNKGMK